MNVNRLVSLVFGLLAVGVLLLGWVLGVAPRLDEAARADAERATVETQNTAHEARLAELAAQHERIDELRAELGQLQRFVPAAHLLEDFLDGLDAEAATADVVLSQVSMGEPVIAGEPAGESGPALIAIPVTVTIQGSLEAALEFIDAAQHADRVFLVSGLSLEDGGAVLTGSLYVIAEPSGVAPAQ